MAVADKFFGNCFFFIYILNKLNSTSVIFSADVFMFTMIKMQFYIEYIYYNKLGILVHAEQRYKSYCSRNCS